MSDSLKPWTRWHSWWYWNLYAPTFGELRKRRVHRKWLRYKRLSKESMRECDGRS